MSLLKGEIQADNGDALYPHTSSEVVFGPDGRTVQEQINTLSEQIESVDVSWDGVTGKPSTFPPSTHNHDDVYMKQGSAEIKFTNDDYLGHDDSVNRFYRISDKTGNQTKYLIYDTQHKPTKADVGLGSVNNWGATTAVNDASTTKYATASAVKQAYDKAVQAVNASGTATLIPSTAVKHTLPAGKAYKNDVTKVGLLTFPHDGFVRVVNKSAMSHGYYLVAYSITTSRGGDSKNLLGIPGMYITPNATSAKALLDLFTGAVGLRVSKANADTWGNTGRSVYSTSTSGTPIAINLPTIFEVRGGVPYLFTYEVVSSTVTATSMDMPPFDICYDIKKV